MPELPKKKDAKAEKTPPRRRRLKGKALGELRTAFKRYKRTVRDRDNKREELLDEQDLNMDQVPDWKSGVVFDTIPQQQDGHEPSAHDKPVPIGHITKESRAAQRPLVAEVEQAYGELEDLIERLAEKLSCMPRDINVETGQITGEPVIGVDPYADPEEIRKKMADSLNELLEALDQVEAPAGEKVAAE